MLLGVDVDWNKIREEFEVTKTDKIYLNHAAKSPIPNYVEQALIDYIKNCKANNIEYYPDCVDENRVFKTYISRLINGDVNNLTVMSNTSTGLNLCADHIEWNEDDEVIIYEKDFPANVFPFLKLKNKYGVKINCC